MAEESDIFLEGAAASLKPDYTPTIPNLIQDLNIDNFYTTDEKDILAQINTDEPNLAKLFIIGMPSDIGVRALDGRAGAEKGPDAFREMLSLCAMPSNPVDGNTLFNRVKIYDCGNIKVDQGQA